MYYFGPWSDPDNLSLEDEKFYEIEGAPPLPDRGPGVASRALAARFEELFDQVMPSVNLATP